MNERLEDHLAEVERTRPGFAFAPAAQKADLERLRQALACRLQIPIPPDLKTWYSWHNGQRDREALAANHRLLTVEEAIEAWDFFLSWQRISTRHPPEGAVRVGQPFPRFKILLNTTGQLLGGQLEYRQRGGESMDPQGRPIPLDRVSFVNAQEARAAGVDLEADVQWHTYPPLFFNDAGQSISDRLPQWEWSGY